MNANYCDNPKGLNLAMHAMQQKRGWIVTIFCATTTGDGS
jgi:hypothetical protein